MGLENVLCLSGPCFLLPSMLLGCKQLERGALGQLSELWCPASKCRGDLR